MLLMVKKCSYCVRKVPNDDGPSMSIIEFCLHGGGGSSAASKASMPWRKVRWQSVSLINCHKHFFIHCHEIRAIVTTWKWSKLKFLVCGAQWSLSLRFFKMQFLTALLVLGCFANIGELLNHL